MKKINCIIVDDEPNAIKLLEEHIEKVPFLQLTQKCYDAFEAIDYLRQKPVNLLFLDINMPQMNGIEVASGLSKQQRIVFTTAYSSYALEGYEYNTLDYLLKPITFKRFMQAAYKAQDFFLAPDTIGTAISPQQNQDDFFFLKSGKQIVRVAYDKILYFEASQEYVDVVTTDGKTLIYKRMKQLELELPSIFVRIHNSYIINLNHLVKIEDNRVFIGAERLAISLSYKEQFLKIVEKKLL